MFEFATSNEPGFPFRYVVRAAFEVLVLICKHPLRGNADVAGFDQLPDSLVLYGAGLNPEPLNRLNCLNPKPPNPRHKTQTPKP